MANNPKTIEKIKNNTKTTLINKKDNQTPK